MTEERMIRIDYESWYSQNFIIPDWEDMEPAPPKDWKPICYDSQYNKLNEIMSKQTEMSDKYAENFAKLNNMFGQVQESMGKILEVQIEQTKAIKNLQDNNMYQ